MQLQEKCLKALCKMFMESFQKWFDSNEGCMAALMLNDSEMQILLAKEEGKNYDTFFVFNKDGLSQFSVDKEKSTVLQNFLTTEKKIIPYGVETGGTINRPDIESIVTIGGFSSPREIQSRILKQLDLLATDIISPGVY